MKNRRKSDEQKGWVRGYLSFTQLKEVGKKTGNKAREKINDGTPGNKLHDIVHVYACMVSEQ